MTTFYVKKSTDDICHYGILGMKWGVRRYQNADGSLTSAGRERYGDNSLRSGYKIDNAMGFLSKSTPVFRQKEYATQKKIAKNTKGYNSLWKTDIKDIKSQKEKNEKIINAIREKRSGEAAGAFLRDLGYKDTARGRKEILSLFDTKELKSMSDTNQAARIAQIAIAGALGAATIYHSTALAMPVIDLIADVKVKAVTDAFIKKQKELTSRNIWKDITKYFGNSTSRSKDEDLVGLLNNNLSTVSNGFDVGSSVMKFTRESNSTAHALSSEGFSIKDLPSQWINAAIPRSKSVRTSVVPSTSEIDQLANIRQINTNTSNASEVLNTATKKITSYRGVQK